MTRLAYLLALLFIASPLLADVNLAKELPPLEVIEESYDEVIVVDTRKSYSKVYFLRDGKLHAERIFDDTMNWSAEDGEFILDWNDYGSCHRVIRFKAYTHLQIPLTEHDEGNHHFLPWWAMGRNMTDLKQPER